MTPAEQLPCEIGRALLTLRRRRASTHDVGERDALAQTIDALEQQLTGLAAADELAVAAALPDAQEALERALAAVRRGPFDGYLRALEAHFDDFAAIAAVLHAPPPAMPDRAPAATAPSAPVSLSAASPAPGAKPSGLTSPKGLPPPVRATDFASLQDEYATWYAACVVRPECRKELAYCVKRLHDGQAIYEEVGTQLTIPWLFVGITHGMECSFNFRCHMHNGDPLKGRTVNVPSGRPTSCEPPFTWAQSATDALIYMGYHEVSDWSPTHMLYLFERYNGMGYRRRGVPTPYLWSFSNLYEKGKFVADGRYDAQAVSRQCGAALLLQALIG